MMGLLFLAAESYKAVVVSILPDFTAEGIYSLVDHSEATLLYVGPNVKKKIDPKMMKGLKATIFMDDMTIVEADDATQKAFDGVEAAFVKAYPDGVKLEDMNLPTDNLDKLAVINYTSGSTGNPKGVMLTHLNLSGNVEFACQRIPHKPGDKVLSMLPIAHMFWTRKKFSCFLVEQTITRLIRITRPLNSLMPFLRLSTTQSLPIKLISA